MRRSIFTSVGLGLSLFFVCGASRANATIQLTISGQLGGAPGQINDFDPLAVSGVLGTAAGNITLVNAFAAGSADLTTGTARARSEGKSKIAGAGYPNATASVSDKVTFHGPGPTVRVQLHVTADGTFSSAGTGDGLVQQVAAVSLSAGTFQTSVIFERDLTLSTTAAPIEAFVTTIRTPGPDAGFIVTHPTVGTSAASLDIDKDFPVETPMFVAVTTSVQAGAIGAPIDISIDTDFGNTARLSMTLPDGYTFTSESGAFLAQAGAPGLGLPPDGGTGEHGSPGFDGGPAGDAGEIGDGGSSADGSSGPTDGGSGPTGGPDAASSSGGASSPDGGGADGGTAGGGSSDSGCSSTGSASSAGASVVALFALASLVRRRRRKAASR